MSIALLHQVHDETRRLAVAGSGTAPGDFRLKKLIDPLKQAGAKAPVFAKLADAANAVVEASEKSAPDAVLELLALSTAVRYTQGETGLPGTLGPIGVKVPLARPTELSARLLQPLMETLSRTGGGRLEVVKDGYERVAFKDVRLVYRAITGLDDAYSEIADLFAEKIIPESYGPGIAPLLREGYDAKGNKGSARRLKLLHKFDPAGTRSLVMEALEKGSKEVKVAALACLGLHSDDVHILVEQASAKAADVRAAAYWGLAQLDAEESVAALTKVMAGKELDAAGKALAASKGPRLLKAILAGLRGELAALYETKDKKAVSEHVERLGSFLQAIREREDKDSEATLFDLFKQRDKIAKLKGDTLSGSDLNEDVARTMACGSARMADALVASRAALVDKELRHALDAAHRHYPAEKVYELFSPLFSGKKQGETVRDGILGQERRAKYWQGGARPVDPRWLDLAIAGKHDDLVKELAQPGHAGLNKHLSDAVREAAKSPKKAEELLNAVRTMAAVGHPEFEASFFAAVAASNFKTNYSAGVYYGQLIDKLPKTAIPALEALVPKFASHHTRHWTEQIDALRAKPDPA